MENECNDCEFHIDPSVKKTITADEFNALYDGLAGAISRGPKGFPISGLRVIALEVRKEDDTTPGAIRACVSTFVQSIFRASEASTILEPIMSVEIETPEKFVGDILNDLTSQRRAEIQAVDARSSWSIITAFVPLYTLLGYATTLRSMTQGEGSFSMEYLSHQTVADSATANSMIIST